MKKIALFMLAPLTDGGGAEKYFINLAKNLRQRGIEADIITMDKTFIERFAKWLYLFYYRKWFRHIDTSGRESESSIKEILDKANWIRVNFENLGKTLRAYDAIYSKNEIVDLALLKRSGYKNLPPVIVGVHTPLYYPEAKSFNSKLHNFLYSGILYKWLLRGTKCIHVSNSSAKEFAEKNFKEKCELIYYPFSIDEIVRMSQNFVSDLVFEKGKFNIIFAGRLSEQKGVSALANIISKISENTDISKKIRLNIFGSGDTKHENIINELERKYTFVKHFGHIENKFMPNILTKQNLLISTSQWETLPYNILEAQAMGIPVIAFDIPGPADILINGKTGFLAESENDFLNKITDLADYKIQLDKNEVIQNIEKKFNPEKIYSEMISMFEKYSMS